MLTKKTPLMMLLGSLLLAAPAIAQDLDGGCPNPDALPVRYRCHFTQAPSESFEISWPNRRFPLGVIQNSLGFNSQRSVGQTCDGLRPIKEISVDQRDGNLLNFGCDTTTWLKINSARPQDSRMPTFNMEDAEGLRLTCDAG